MAPWTVARQAPLPMEISRQESWSGLPFPMPWDLPDPGTEPAALASPALAGRFFTTEPPGKPPELALPTLKNKILANGGLLRKAQRPPRKNGGSGLQSTEITDEEEPDSRGDPPTSLPETQGQKSQQRRVVSLLKVMPRKNCSSVSTAQKWNSHLVSFVKMSVFLMLLRLLLISDLHVLRASEGVFFFFNCLFKANGSCK